MSAFGGSAALDFAIISGIFGGLLLISTVIGQIIATTNGKDQLEKSSNRTIALVITIIGPFCMWLHWAIAWLVQLHPMVEPVATMGGEK